MPQPVKSVLVANKDFDHLNWFVSSVRRRRRGYRDAAPSPPETSTLAAARIDSQTRLSKLSSLPSLLFLASSSTSFHTRFTFLHLMLPLSVIFFWSNFLLSSLSSTASVLIFLTVAS